MALEYKFEQGQMRVKPSGSKGKLCWYLMILFMLLTFGGVAWLFFSGYLTSADAETKNSFATSLRGKMNEQKRLLEKRKITIDNLTQELGVIKREFKIQKVANVELNTKLQLAEQKLSDADEELLLYGNILNAKDLKQGLHIQHFGLKLVKVDKEGKKLQTNQRFHYRVVLSYIRSDNSSVSGSFSINIIGKQKGKSLTLSHKKLVPAGEGTALTGFSLKYYQSMEGDIELPSDFVPEKVKLTVSPSSGKTLEKKYDWATAIK